MIWMEKIYRLWCKMKGKNKNATILKTNNEKTMVSPHCVACSNNINRFTIEQQAKGFLNSLGVKITFTKGSILAHILFCFK